MAQVETKFFTPAEAKKTLPLVKRIVRDILNNAYQIKTIAESLGGKIDDNEEAARLIRDVDFFMRELEEIGCSYRDWSYEVGLVDFPSIIDGEEVLLCWRTDEPEIIYFHGVNEGYAGRKLIPEEYL